MPAVQLGIFVLDASGSMSDSISGESSETTKAWQVEEMLCLPLEKPRETAEDFRELLETCGVVSRLQHSQRADYIDMAVIRFGVDAELYVPAGAPLDEPAQPVRGWELSPPGTKLDPASGQHYILGGRPFDLRTDIDGSGTSIRAGLALADDLAQKWIEKQEEDPSVEPFVSIVLMSDMLNNEGHESDLLQIATEIKTSKVLRDRPQTLLAAAAYGHNANLDLMQQLATSGPAEQPHKYAIKTSNPKELRGFYLASMSAQVEERG